MWLPKHPLRGERIHKLQSIDTVDNEKEKTTYTLNMDEPQRSHAERTWKKTISKVAYNLAMLVKWLEHWHEHQRVIDSISHQGHNLGCRFDPCP